MENKSNYFVIILIIAIIFLWFKIDGIKEERDDLEAELSNYEYALEEANNNIEELNSIIEDAQDYAWSSYEEMGEALDNLYILDAVNP